MALRRAIAIICAVALLTLGIVHSVYHVGGAVAAVALQGDVVPSDDSPDAPKKAPVATDYCHCCSMIAVAMSAQPVVPIPVAVDLSTGRFDEKPPHPSVVETRPPIFSI
ncbi:MAG: hypothetical protein ABIL01_32360 [Pseudomonadota bacterium]